MSTKHIEALKLALEGAANYIDALGGDSRKYRQALAEQPAQQEPVAVELVGVEEAIKEGAGFWKSCTGCYETNEGYPPTGAFFSSIFKCYMGHGCSECGGIGAIWDDVDYEAMEYEMMRDEAAPQPAQQEPVAVVAPHPDYVDWLRPEPPVGTLLYTSPTAQRKPLTDEEMADFLGDRYHSMTENELEFFRLGEAAHGIKGDA